MCGGGKAQEKYVEIFIDDGLIMLHLYKGMNILDGGFFSLEQVNMVLSGENRC